MAIAIEGTIRKMKNRRHLASQRREAQLQQLLQQFETASGKIVKTLTDAYKATMGKQFDQSNKILHKLDGVVEDKILDSFLELNDTMAGVVGLEATASVRRRKKVAITSEDEVAYIWVNYLEEPTQLYITPLEHHSKDRVLDELAEVVQEDWGTDLEYHAGFGEEGVKSLSQLLKGKPLQEALRQLEYADIAVIDTPVPANRLKVSAQEPRWHDVGRADAPVATIDIYQTGFYDDPESEEGGGLPDFFEYKAYLSEMEGKPYDGAYGVADYTEGNSATEAVKKMIDQWSRAGFLE